MPFSEIFRKQAALVVRALPQVVREDCFAPKRGTGINLFIREMPREYDGMAGLLFYSRY